MGSYSRLMRITASRHCPTRTFLIYIFSVTPPRQVLVFRRSTRSRLGESISQSSTNTLRQPPEISEPMTTPPCPSAIVQWRTMMFSEGMFQRRPSSLRPLLIAMQSSPVWKRQFSMSTFSHDSGSHPSPLGPSLMMVRPRTVIFFDSRGCTTQKGERSRVTPSSRMFSHL